MSIIFPKQENVQALNLAMSRAGSSREAWGDVFPLATTLVFRNAKKSCKYFF